MTEISGTKCANHDGTAQVCAECLETIGGLLDALREIAKGEGAYSRDQLTHANNTIENMKKIASDATEKVLRVQPPERSSL